MRRPDRVFGSRAEGADAATPPVSPPPTPPTYLLSILDLEPAFKLYIGLD